MRLAVSGSRGSGRVSSALYTKLYGLGVAGDLLEALQAACATNPEILPQKAKQTVGHVHRWRKGGHPPCHHRLRCNPHQRQRHLPRRAVNRINRMTCSATVTLSVPCQSSENPARRCRTRLAVEAAEMVVCTSWNTEARMIGLVWLGHSCAPSLKSEMRDK